RAEPFGQVACEAMSAGIPVVAARVGGLPEILDPPRAGILVAPANPTAMASVTSALLANGERYRRLSEAGPERVRQRYSAARMGALTRGVYREVLE
ncbi:MAG: glycosyltransferase, partial [Candidatus Dormibacteria bacterium]